MRAALAPVRKPLPKADFGQLVRLGAAGAVANAATRAALNPLELSKTRAQAAAASGIELRMTTTSRRSWASRRRRPVALH